MNQVRPDNSRAVRILHTADLQLGMPFHWAAGDAGAKLREVRLEVLSRIGSIARDETVDVVVVAGDFFDSNTVDDRTVSAACARIRDAKVPFVVIPGNHDFCAGPDCVYRRRHFALSRPDNLLILTERAPRVLLDGRLVVLPAPLTKRHSVEDTTAHLVDAFGRDIAPRAVRVGLAHGDVAGFARDDDGAARNFIAANRAALARLDYLALGDWHGTKRIDDRTWYSGTPEPTGFKDNSPGQVLVVTIDGPGAPPTVETRAVARTRFVSWHREVMTSEDVTRLEVELAAIAEPLDTVLQIELAGELSLSEANRVEELISRSRGAFLHLRETHDNLVADVSMNDVVDLVPDGFARVVAARLVERSRDPSDDGRSAALALKLLRQAVIQMGGA
jgi:DNA repair exonuclease SbcCD nuclease subunit